MSWKILVSELEATGSTYATYSTDLSRTLDDSKNKINDAFDERQFSGDAANSIKNYFMYVHIRILDALKSASDTFHAEYSGNYYDKYINDSLYENRWGNLSQDGLEEKKKWIANSLKSDIYPNQLINNLNATYSSAACIVSLSSISPDSIGVTLDEAVYRLEKLIKEVDSAEKNGSAIFGENGVGANLINALRAYVNGCIAKKISIDNFDASVAQSLFEETGLKEAYFAAMREMKDNRDAMIANDEIIYTHVLERQEEERALLEEKAKALQWEAILIGVGFFLLGAAVTLLTAGAAAPVFIGIGAAFTALNTYERFQKINQDEELGSSYDFASSTAKGVVKDTLDESAGDIARNGIKGVHSLNPKTIIAQTLANAPVLVSDSTPMEQSMYSGAITLASEKIIKGKPSFSTVTDVVGAVFQGKKDTEVEEAKESERNKIQEMQQTKDAKQRARDYANNGFSTSFAQAWT